MGVGIEKREGEVGDGVMFNGEFETFPSGKDDESKFQMIYIIRLSCKAALLQPNTRTPITQIISHTLQLTC